MKFSFLRWLPFILCVSGVFYLSSQPGNTLGEEPFPHWDKAAHFCAFFVLITCLGYAIGKKRICTRPKLCFLILIGFGILFGVSDEWHQSFVPNRDVSGYDLLADVSGSFVGALFVLRMFRSPIPKF